MPNTPVPAAASGLPSPTRRALLGRGVPATLALAALPVAAAPVIVAPDPIFAALAAHMAAWVEFGDSSALTDEIAAEQQGRRITAADRARDREADRNESTTLDTLVSTAPTSVAGLIAALTWLSNEVADYERTDQFIANVVVSPLAGEADV